MSEERYHLTLRTGGKVRRFTLKRDSTGEIRMEREPPPEPKNATSAREIIVGEDGPRAE